MSKRVALLMGGRSQMSDIVAARAPGANFAVHDRGGTTNTK